MCIVIYGTFYGICATALLNMERRAISLRQLSFFHWQYNDTVIL